MKVEFISHLRLTRSPYWRSHSVLLVDGGRQTDAQFLNVPLLYGHGNVHVGLGLRVLMPPNSLAKMHEDRHRH